MADHVEQPERHTATGEHPVTANELQHVVKVHDLRVIAGVIVTLVVGTVSGWLLLQNEARAQAGIVTHEVVNRLQRAEQAQRDHIADSREVHKGIQLDVQEMQHDMHEIQRDIRDLYRTITTGRPSPRLERPVDGGN